MLMDANPVPVALTPEEAARRAGLPEPARKALAEADLRRAAAGNSAAALPAGELNGPRTIEPTRYGDWERNGIAYDF